eukprot:353154-Chlamydomonas_euryale.AAC.2
MTTQLLLWRRRWRYRVPSPSPQVGCPVSLAREASVAVASENALGLVRNAPAGAQKLLAQLLHQTYVAAAAAAAAAAHAPAAVAAAPALVVAAAAAQLVAAWPPSESGAAL